VLQAAGERLFTMKYNPTAENIARLLYEVAREAGFPVVEVVLWETDSASATYRP
jgi:6-pyruvoyltetrahydropterin/6-carboxytetrahydropterin synthase